MIMTHIIGSSVHNQLCMLLTRRRRTAQMARRQILYISLLPLYLIVDNMLHTSIRGVVSTSTAAHLPHRPPAHNNGLYYTYDIRYEQIEGGFNIVSRGMF